MPPANLRRISHQRRNLVQALSLHRQLAAEGVPVDEAGPRQPGLLVDGPEVAPEVVHVVAAAIGDGEVPVVRTSGDARHDCVFRPGGARLRSSHGARARGTKRGASLPFSVLVSAPAGRMNGVQSPRPGL